MSEQVKVFRVSECDAVAATTAKEALQWYKQELSLDDDDLYSIDEIKEVELDRKVNKEEGSEEMVTVQEIVNEYYRGKPFIAISWYL